MPSRKKISSTASFSGQTTIDRASRSDQLSGALERELTWDLLAINTHLEDIRRMWANLLGVSGPQWLILMAISELDGGEGVSVGEVSSKLYVNSTFVTAQTKSLERWGFLVRATSPSDARIVLMSLTDKARREIAKLAATRNKFSDYVFADIGDRTVRDITDSLSRIRQRVETAALQMKLDSRESKRVISSA